ncbi:hypothetical protein KF840_20100 [bacterium]|nr:hypothetical protein [bacterium]
MRVVVSGTSGRFGRPLVGRVRAIAAVPSRQRPRALVAASVIGVHDDRQHRSAFTAHAGGTLVRDRVRYRLPFRALDDLIAGGPAARDLQRIFDNRRGAVAALFAAPVADTQEAS